MLYQGITDIHTMMEIHPIITTSNLLFDAITLIEGYTVLSFTIKKYIMDNVARLLREEMSVDTKFTLSYTLSALNRFIIEDDVLTELFSYMCSLGEPLLLLQHSSIIVYNTPDVIPIPHYHFIKDCMSNNGKTIGQYSYHIFHVFFMIGRVVAFVVSLQKKAVYHYIVTSDIDGTSLSIIKTLIPITF